MKSILVTIFFSFFATHASGAPQVSDLFVSANIESCKAIADVADSCQIMRDNFKQLEILASKNPGPEARRWAGEIQQTRVAETMICEMAAYHQKHEMAMAVLTFDAPFSISVSKLDRGVFGRVEFQPKQVDGDLIRVDSRSKMTVYGSLFCQAVDRAEGRDPVKALQNIAIELSGQR